MMPWKQRNHETTRRWVLIAAPIMMMNTAWAQGYGEVHTGLSNAPRQQAPALFPVYLQATHPQTPRGRKTKPAHSSTILRGKFFHMLGSSTTEIFHFHANGTYSRLRIMVNAGFSSRQRVRGIYRIRGTQITLHFQQVQSASQSGGSATAGKQAFKGQQTCKFKLLPAGRGLDICGVHLDVYHL